MLNAFHSFRKMLDRIPEKNNIGFEDGTTHALWTFPRTTGNFFFSRE